MALKDKKGRYFNINHIYVKNGYAEVRLNEYYDENERKNSPEKMRTLNVCDIRLPEKILDEILTKVYGVLKTYETHVRTEYVPDKKDKKGNVIQKGYKKDIYQAPFAEFEDC